MLDTKENTYNKEHNTGNTEELFIIILCNISKEYNIVFNLQNSKCDRLIFSVRLYLITIEKMREKAMIFQTPS